MQRRNFLRAICALPLAAIPIAVTAEQKLLNGKLGTYEGFTFHGSQRGTWSGGPAHLQNLPRPAMEFRGDTDTGWYTDTDGSLKFAVCGRRDGTALYEALRYGGPDVKV